MRRNADPINRRNADPINRRNADPINPRNADPINRREADLINRRNADLINRRSARPIASAALLSLVISTASLLGQEADPAGRWRGEIELSDSTAVEVHVELGRATSGEWQGTILMPDRQQQAAALERLSVGSEGIRFSTPYIPGAPAFSGRLQAEGNQIVGDVTIDSPPPPPGTDIFLVSLAVDASSWRMGEAVNITDREGYDNQPRFLPEGDSLLYTSIRGDQADIYRHEVSSGRALQVTATDQSEYSPTPLPSGAGFSTIRVEDDGTQRLWSFDSSGGQPQLLLPDLAPVGYQGWLDDDRLALFVLGEPPTLVLARVGESAFETVAKNVGRSIHLTPDGAAVSFVHKASEDDWRIEFLDLESRARRTVIATRDGNEDFIFTPDGRILMGDGSALFVSSPGDAPPIWKQVADLATSGVTGITRLAMSSDSRHLAVVAERPEGDSAPERADHGFTLSRQPEE